MSPSGNRQQVTEVSINRRHAITITAEHTVTLCRAMLDAPAFCFQRTESCKDTTQPYCVPSSHQARYTLTFLIVKERYSVQNCARAERTAEGCVVQPIGSVVRSQLTVVSNPLQIPTGGAGRDRTDDLLLAKQALSQLSYSPDSY